MLFPFYLCCRNILSLFQTAEIPAFIGILRQPPVLIFQIVYHRYQTLGKKEVLIMLTASHKLMFGHLFY
jgi:hypothetical protein